MGTGPFDGPTGLRLIGYARVSTEEQATSGLSIVAQRGRLKAHAKAHNYRLVRIETDAGVSGKVPPSRRPGLARAMDTVREGGADGIVFLKLDRLSRSVHDILRLADEARRKGWHLLSVNEHIDTSTAAGKFMLRVLAALAEMERDQISERTIFGMREIAEEGRCRSRFLPFGYRVAGAEEETSLRAGDRRQLVEHREETQILEEMLDMRRRGLGARRIAKILSTNGPNPRTGTMWNPSTVAAILRTAEKRAAFDHRVRKG